MALLPWVRFATAAWFAVAGAAASGADPGERVLRIGMPIVPETFDPARADNM